MGHGQPGQQPDRRLYPGHDYDPDKARKGTEEKGLGLDRFIIGNTPLEVREGRFDYDVRRDPARAGNGNDLPDPVFLPPFSPFTARPH
ncbi:hypothetical protein GEO60473_01640 [Geobacter sp. 60473]|nr:hypothetical protein GEO60473_01640 [Geobacter sp. 60473]